MILFLAREKFAVEIIADYAGAVVADEHAIRVKHRDYLEADVVLQQPLLDLL